MPEERGIERLWWGRGPLPRLARAALLPLELAYTGVVATRNALYNVHALRTGPPALPTISIGNITAGGTGKTPMAAWTAARLVGAGHRPAVVMRGYGGDEPMVHARLNPEVPVIVAPDRLAGIAEARALGADVAVLDDAFQHRRAGRHADIVLVSADRWTRARRRLPAGPWREPPGALRRATLIVVTRKAATGDAAEMVCADVARIAPDVPTAMVHLRLGELRRMDEGARMPLAELAGRRVLAVAAVGDPAAFIRQLADAGAVVRFDIFPDHHAFTAADTGRLAAEVAPEELLVCTLKDAVKLAPSWPPAAAPVWYLSQQVVVERGETALQAVLDAALRARPLHP